MGIRSVSFIALVLCIASASSAGTSDKFRLILPNVDSSRAAEEIDDFVKYGCESLIVITNEAQHKMRIGCKSADEKTRESLLLPGNSFLFTIRPLQDGSSDYWCTLLYQQHWVRFDAYSESSHQYLCPGKKVYKYSVRNDGIYADPDKNGGFKIRSLLKGHNKFMLWQYYDEAEKATDGLLMTAFVDGGVCSDLPDHFDDKTAAITVCNHQCIYAYDNRRCTGPVQKLQAGEGCQDFVLGDDLRAKVSAIKGC